MVRYLNLLFLISSVRLLAPSGGLDRPKIRKKYYLDRAPRKIDKPPKDVATLARLLKSLDSGNLDFLIKSSFPLIIFCFFFFLEFKSYVYFANFFANMLRNFAKFYFSNTNTETSNVMASIAFLNDVRYDIDHNVKDFTSYFSDEFVKIGRLKGLIPFLFYQIFSYLMKAPCFVVGACIMVAVIAIPILIQSFFRYFQDLIVDNFEEYMSLRLPIKYIDEPQNTTKAPLSQKPPSRTDNMKILKESISWVENETYLSRWIYLARLIIRGIGLAASLIKKIFTYLYSSTSSCFEYFMPSDYFHNVSYNAENVAYTSLLNKKASFHNRLSGAETYSIFKQFSKGSVGIMDNELKMITYCIQAFLILIAEIYMLYKPQVDMNQKENWILPILPYIISASSYAYFLFKQYSTLIEEVEEEKILTERAEQDLKRHVEDVFDDKNVTFVDVKWEEENYSKLKNKLFANKRLLKNSMASFQHNMRMIRYAYFALSVFAILLFNPQWTLTKILKYGINYQKLVKAKPDTQENLFLLLDSQGVKTKDREKEFLDSIVSLVRSIFDPNNIAEADLRAISSQHFGGANYDIIFPAIYNQFNNNQDNQIMNGQSRAAHKLSDYDFLKNLCTDHAGYICKIIDTLNIDSNLILKSFVDKLKIGDTNSIMTQANAVVADLTKYWTTRYSPLENLKNIILMLNIEKANSNLAASFEVISYAIYLITLFGVFYSLSGRFLECIQKVSDAFLRRREEEEKLEYCISALNSPDEKNTHQKLKHNNSGEVEISLDNFTYRESVSVKKSDITWEELKSYIEQAKVLRETIKEDYKVRNNPLDIKGQLEMFARKRGG